jgi:L-2-hydroxyglutarate oxidase LhgO
MYNLIIIGAGAVGLSVARYFQVERQWRCLVLEREPRIGQGISSRNSEVIHAGLYYSTGSLKARLCIEGKERLYHYLERNNLPYQRCGKYVVAAPDQADELEQLCDQGSINGVNDLELIDGVSRQHRVKQLALCPALFSPSTGILSADSWMRHLAGEFQAAGGDLALNTVFCAMAPVGDTLHLTVSDSTGDTMIVEAEKAVNATGLSALDVAELAGFRYQEQGYDLKYCKGSYFSVPGAKGSFQHLIYPLPTPNSLGIHIRLDLLGEVRLGPDAEYLPDNVPVYTVDPSLEGEFRRQVRQYWPTIDQYPLEPDWAGVRPHLFFEDSFYQDFFIVSEAEAGCPGWINLFGVDSPGLTAAMAIGPFIETLWV